MPGLSTWRARSRGRQGLGRLPLPPGLTGGTSFSASQLLNKGTEHYSYPCTPTTMLPRSAYWHHITGSQNIAEASSYAGESLLGPTLTCGRGLLGKGLGCDSSPEPASVPTGEGYGAPQASSETDLLDRFILLKPKPSQGDSSEARTPPQ